MLGAIESIATYPRAGSQGGAGMEKEPVGQAPESNAATVIAARVACQTEKSFSTPLLKPKPSGLFALTRFSPAFRSEVSLSNGKGKDHSGSKGRT